MLYLTFGFLEWYESDDSRQAHLAPLLTVPVALNRKTAKGKAFRASIEYSGDDFETNLSLVEKMRRDFVIEIPTVEEEDTPTAYFSRFEAILEQKKRWRIRRHLSLSLLSFGKLLMYRDLDPKTWPAGQSIAKHARVAELFEGRRHDGIVHAEEYPIDAPEMKHEVPMLIVDADSSQHSALIDAMRGQNPSSKGRPGTGKSQTITNLIAAAIGQRQDLLFVSEKLAALEVVRRRLDETGLGMFCLELHSHKTRKDSLLTDLAPRWRRGTFRDPRELDQHLAVVEEKKRLLTRYASLINKTIEPFKATVFEILWARDLAYQELQFDRALVEKLLLSSVIQFTPTDVAQTEHFLSVHAQHLAGVLRACSRLEQHPWAWVDAPISFEDQERICNLLGDSRLICPSRGAASAGISRRRCVGGLQPSGAQRGCGVSGNPAQCERTASATCPGAVPGCARTRGAVRFHRRGGKRVDNTSGPGRLHLGKQSSAAAEKRCGGIPGPDGRGADRARAPRTATHVAFGKTLNRAARRERLLSKAEECLAALATLLGSQVSFDTQNIQRILNCLRALEKAPAEVLHLRTPNLESEGAGRIIENAAARARELEQEHRKLDESFDLSMLADPADATPASRSCRRDRGRQHLAAVLRSPISHWPPRLQGPSAKCGESIPKTIAHDLRAVADHLQARLILMRMPDVESFLERTSRGSRPDGTIGRSSSSEPGGIRPASRE